MSRLVELVCAALMFLLTWLMWMRAARIASYGDTTDVLRIAIGPFVYFMTAMILLSGLLHLYRALSPATR